MTTLYKNTSTGTQVWTINSVTDGFQITTQRNINGKKVVKFHPVTPKNVGKSNETTVEQQTQLEIESRVKKQLDKGYVTSESEALAPATNTLNLVQPMLAKVYEKESHKIKDGEIIFVQPKLDGHRAMYKDGVLYSRGGKEINLPHIKKAIAAIPGIDNLHLDGEIYVHGLSLQEIGSLIKRPREESLSLKYYVYDVVDNRPYKERFETIQKVVPTSCQTVVCLETECFYKGNLPVSKFHQKNLERGFEGTMVRYGSKPYEFGKRSDSLLKLKDFCDTEFTVVDKRLGVPIVAGLRLTVFECKLPDGRTFDVTAPGTAIEKDAAWYEDNIGKVLTVKHFGYSDDGIPLLPVALRWREDV